MNRKQKAPLIDFSAAFTSTISIVLSIVLTHAIVIVLRTNAHHLLLPLLITISGFVGAAHQLNTEQKKLIHTHYLVVWLFWLFCLSLKTELDQHSDRVTVPPQYYQLLHGMSYCLSLTWGIVSTQNRYLRSIFCLLIAFIILTEEEAPLSPVWLSYLQLFCYAFIYFFASFTIENPEICALWCLFFDYPIPLFVLAMFQVIAYIGTAFFSLPDEKHL
jgi:hypothetical protein